MAGQASGGPRRNGSCRPLRGPLTQVRRQRDPCARGPPEPQPAMALVLGASSCSQPCDQVVEARPRDRQEFREVLTIRLRDGSVSTITDRARKLGERLVELACGGDER